MAQDRSVSADPAVRAARAIALRNVGQDIETMSIIIRNAYRERTEEIKREIETHCREVFDRECGKPRK